MSEEQKNNVPLIGEIFVEGEAPPQYFQAFLNVQKKSEDAAAKSEAAAGRAEAAAEKIQLDQEYFDTVVFSVDQSAEIAATAARDATESEQNAKDDADRAEGAAGNAERAAVEAGDALKLTKELADSVESPVSYKPQTLPQKEQTQARNNIDAASKSTAETENTELWARIAELENLIFNYPVLAATGSLGANATWYSNESSGLYFTGITEVHIVKEYVVTGNENATWAGDEGRTGTITCYRTGTVVTICSNGAQKIRLSPDSRYLFGGWTNLTKITGLELIDASNVTLLNGMAYNSKITSIDISMWNAPKLQNMVGMFSGCQYLQTVKLPKYGMPALSGTDQIFNGCTALREVDFGREVQTIGAKAFYKNLALEKVTGLSKVKSIGDWAFLYTPQLAAVDLKANRMESIGASACRLSGIEESVDLSAVQLENVGEYATRHKRWSLAKLSELASVLVPTVYIDVPNPDSQENYADIPFATADGDNYSVAEAGCSALCLYHIWNALYAGTDKVYENFEAWFNGTINADGTFAENNKMDGRAIPTMLELLGWSHEWAYTNGAEQKQIVTERLQRGLPTMAVMPSANNTDGTHAVVIIGSDANTGKFAIIDSKVIGTTGVVSWVAFEDIFVEGETHISLLNCTVSA